MSQRRAEVGAIQCIKQRLASTMSRVKGRIAMGDRHSECRKKKRKRERKKKNKLSAKMSTKRNLMIVSTKPNSFERETERATRFLYSFKTGAHRKRLYPPLC